MSTFINMDFNNTTNKWWVEYSDDNNNLQIEQFDSKTQAITRYIELIG